VFCVICLIFELKKIKATSKLIIIAEDEAAEFDNTDATLKENQESVLTIKEIK